MTYMTREQMNKIFRQTHLLSHDDVVKSFELYLEYEKRDKSRTRSAATRVNRVKLCEKLLGKVKKCKLPILTSIYDFYEYSFLVDKIVLELCHADSFEVESEQVTSMESYGGKILITVDCKYLTIAQFAQLQNVKAVTVNDWINRGKLRHAKRVDDEWLIPDTEDIPGRRFDQIEYTVNPDDPIHSDEFPTLAFAELIFISQDQDDSKKFQATFIDHSKDFRSNIELNKEEVERLVYIIIESGKAEIGDLIQFQPDIGKELD